MVDPADDRYLTGTEGQRVFVSPNTIAAADLLRELSADRPAVDRAALRARWAREFPEDEQTERLPPDAIDRRAARQGARADGKPHTAGTLAKKRISGALGALEKLGAIRRDGDGTVTVTDPRLLARIAAM